MPKRKFEEKSLDNKEEIEANVEKIAEISENPVKKRKLETSSVVIGYKKGILLNDESSSEDEIK